MIEQENLLDGNSYKEPSILSVGIEGELKTKLLSLSLWGKITAIAGFANLGLDILTAFTSLIRMSSFFNGLTLFFSLILFTVIFFVNFFLIKFSIHLKKSIDEASGEDMRLSTSYLRSYMRLIGILLIIAIALMLFGTLMMMASGM